MFKPDKIYYEPEIVNYSLGLQLLEKYKDVCKVKIESHNRIKELQNKENKEFPQMKRYLIIGTRKTHKYTPNYKVSNYLVPYTSSGCTAMCLYCYLVCNYNKCAYLRVFVNREEMLDKIIRTAEKSNEELVFEIGSNSDLILENSITGNLEWTIKEFSKSSKGYLTFPTKFDMVDSILNLQGKEKIIVRMSVNPEEIIQKVELGTSRLEKRIEAINKLLKAGYKVGILIAPIIMVDNWEKLYEDLMIRLDKELDSEYKESVFFELIFMTYSYVHRMINQDAFPHSIDLYNADLMKGRGLGKYSYKQDVREYGTEVMQRLLKKYFPRNKLWYIS